MPSVNLADRLLSHPSHLLALVCGSRLLTYGELADRAARWRGGLAAAGIGPGRRVAVLAGNDETVVVAELALVGAGAVVAPVNPLSPPAELSRELAAVDPDAVLVSPAGEAAWAALVAEQTRWIDLRLDPAAWDNAPALPVADVTPDTPAALLFTSGTAGGPKPAVLTHANFDASLRAMLALPVPLAGAGHVGLAVIPLFHVFGLNAVVNLGLAMGATLVLDDYRSSQQVAVLVATHQVTILAGPPTLWRALAGDPEVNSGQFRSVRIALSGAAKLPGEVHRTVHDRLGLRLDEGYGLTETCAVVATTLGRPEAPAGTVGGPLAGVEVRLVDDGGADVLVGDPGEVWVRGPMVSPGYFRPASAPLEERRDAQGWLHTGDVAIVDEQGDLAVVDRVKDLIIVSGFNVFPGEVEAALVLHPDVAAAGVVGQPDPDTGEAVVAHLVAAEGRMIDIDGVIEHCRRHLARYKVPHRVEVRRELPQGLGGKLHRRHLRP
ncbi:MAG: AMP-binding protein [Acidimicrobiia bacterium]|nr:AMP-binding protein [Acidimicrobiia bacterium]